MNQKAFETALSQFDYFADELTSEQKLVLLARLIGRTVREIRMSWLPAALATHYESAKEAARETIRDPGDSPVYALAMSAELLRGSLVSYMLTIRHPYVPLAGPVVVPAGPRKCELCGQAPEAKQHS